MSAFWIDFCGIYIKYAHKIMYEREDSKKILRLLMKFV